MQVATQHVFRNGKRVGSAKITVHFSPPPVVQQMTAGVLSETGLAPTSSVVVGLKHSAFRGKTKSKIQNVLKARRSTPPCMLGCAPGLPRPTPLVRRVSLYAQLS